MSDRPHSPLLRTFGSAARTPFRVATRLEDETGDVVIRFETDRDEPLVLVRISAGLEPLDSALASAAGDRGPLLGGVEAAVEAFVRAIAARTGSGVELDAPTPPLERLPVT